jgi:hypothetical protein
MSRHLLKQIVFLACAVALVLIPLSHAVSAQGTEQTPYYDPRYQNLNQDGGSSREIPAELPATSGNVPLLAVIGVFSLIASAGLQCRSRT